MSNPTTTPGRREPDSTEWSMILAAFEEQRTPEAEERMNEFCIRYWRSLFVFAMSKYGLSKEDAEDCVQGFLSLVARRERAASADPAKGSFRTYLLNAFVFYLKDAFKAKNRIKRGRDVAHVAFDDNFESLSPDHQLSPEENFDRRWAEALFKKARDKLRAEYEDSGKAKEYKILSKFLPGSHDVPDNAKARDLLGLPDAAFRQQKHKIRRELGSLFKKEVKETMLDPAEAEEEARYLLDLLSGHPLTE